MADKSINRHKSQQGSALLWAVVGAAVVGAAGYVIANRSQNEMVSFEAGQSSEMAEIGNISNLSLMQSLVTIKPQANPALPQAQDFSSVPNIYLDPYIPVPGQAQVLKVFKASASPMWTVPGASITTRNSLAVTTANPRAMKDTARATYFGNFFARGFAGAGVPSATLTSNIVMAGPPAGSMAKYTVPLSTTATDMDTKYNINRKASSLLLADLEIPPPPPPSCTIFSTGFSQGGMAPPHPGLSAPMFQVTAPGATVPSRLTASFGSTGFGVFDQVWSNCGSGPSANMGSHSIGNVAGVPAGNCTIDLTNVALPGGAPPNFQVSGPFDFGGNDPYLYYNVGWSDTPGGLWAVGQSWNAANQRKCTGPGVINVTFSVRTRKPPACGWAANPFVFTDDGANYPMTMFTHFASTAATYSPTAGWASVGVRQFGPNNLNWPTQNVATNFDSNVNVTQDNSAMSFTGWYPGYAPPWGQVQASDGQTASCGTGIRIAGYGQWCQWHGIWAQFGQCVNTPTSWPSFFAVGPTSGGNNYPNGDPGTGNGYVDRSSIWECYAYLYNGFNCQGTPAFVRWYPGCFTPETLIRGGNGDLVPIAELKQGDWILNPINHKATRIKRMIVGDEKKDLIEYQAEFGASVTVTTGHPVPTQRGTVKAVDLQPDDEVLAADGAYHPMIMLRTKAPAPGQQVWNIELDTDSKDPSDRMLEANGFVVTGDFVEQEKVDKR